MWFDFVFPEVLSVQDPELHVPITDVPLQDRVSFHVPRIHVSVQNWISFHVPELQSPKRDSSASSGLDFNF